MLFFFISNVGFGFITTRRISLLVMLISLLLHYKDFVCIAKCINQKRLRTSMFLFLIVIFISLFHLLLIIPNPNDTYFTPREIITTIFNVFLFGLWCKVEIKDFKRFAYVALSVIIVQCFASFFALAYQPFRIFVAEHFMSDSYQERAYNVIYNWGGRTAGIGIAWSSGSLILSCGCVLLVLLRMKNMIGTLLFMMLYFIIVVATLFMGRMGVIVEGLVFLYYITTGKKKLQYFIFLFLAVLGLFWAIDYVIALLGLPEEMRDWMMAIFKKDEVESVNSGVVSGDIPPLDVDYIFGTGITLGHYKGLNFTADSGLIRNYTSIGVVGSFCYYLAFLLLMLSPIDRGESKTIKYFFLFNVIVIIACDYKEPYLGMNEVPWFLFTMALLDNSSCCDKSHSSNLVIRENVTTL